MAKNTLTLADADSQLSVMTDIMTETSLSPLCEPLGYSLSV